ncbi:MAG: rhomboid family intramembrane serine protease [Deltaproteobacteria bacterium]|nr:rhomboid family intramembrane serine protease [Deltaproteobacteria bacterium]MBW2446678.1 rhomboid family intramembrane serine protease [Deltaproteobacteria bacterium]
MYGQQSMRFGPPETPKIIKQLMIANLVVFIAQLVVPQSVSDLAAVQPSAVWNGGYLWQPFTYMWMHGGFAHIGMNCFALWMFGSEVALVWGTRRFLRFYLLCGVGAGFIIASWPFATLLFSGTDVDVLDTYTVGASGSIYAVVLAYSLMWPDRRIMLIFPPVSFRAIWLIPLLLGMTIMMGGSEGGISHVGHLGGVLLGWLYLRRHGVVEEMPSSGTAASRAASSSALRRRWRRWRMRKKLRSVQTGQAQLPHENQDRNDGDLTP